MGLMEMYPPRSRAVSDTTSVELVVIEDGWVSEANPGTNYNRKGLGIGRWKYLNRSLLKFDLDIDVEEEEIKEAELRLYGKALFTPLVVEAHYTATGWSEATVTWNNQPPPTTYHWDGEGPDGKHNRHPLRGGLVRGSTGHRLHKTQTRKEALRDP